MAKDARKIAAVGLAAVATIAVTACGTESQSNSNQVSATGSASAKQVQLTLWNVDSGLAEQVDNKAIARFNATHPGYHMTGEYFESTPYLQKLQIAMGAHQAADVFSNWGGGRLYTFVKAGDVLDLTPYLKADPSWANRYLPSVMKSITFNGHVYGVPYGNLQPVNFFYNKQLFAQYHLTPPKTWNQLLSDIQFFKSKGIIPISLGGQDNWPDLMYFEYLVDRLGGQQPFDNVMAGKPNAWSNPVITKALNMMKQLANMGAFEPGFSSIGSNNGSDAALLYSGKAAMWLMGSWGYGTIASDDSAFLKNLGWFPFPSVPGGKGNPNDVCGNPSDFYSIPSYDSPAKMKGAIQFLKDNNLDSKNVADLLQIGYVPAVKGIENQLKKQKDAAYETFYYNLAKNAPYFQQSWDTALPTAEGNELDTDLGKFMVGQMSVAQFEADMNTYLTK